MEIMISIMKRDVRITISVEITVRMEEVVTEVVTEVVDIGKGTWEGTRTRTGLNFGRED